MNAPDVVDVLDVVALGESMVTFLPGRPDDSPTCRPSPG